MKQSLRPRERWAVVMVPALGIIAAYLFDVHRPQHLRLVEARHRLDAISPEPQVVAEFVRRRIMARDVEARLNARRRALAATRNSHHGDPSQETKATAEMAQSTALARILDRRALVLVKSVRADATAARTLMPADVESALTRLMGKQLDQHGLWEMELLGSFAAMRDVLADIGAATELILPVSLAMEPGTGQEGSHRWTLWIWM